MKRIFALSSVVLALAAGAVSHADGDGAMVVQGRITSAAMTPTIPRQVHLISERANGLVGWVVQLPASADARAYEVVPLSAAPGRVDIDVWFYRDLRGETGTGDPCARDAFDAVGGAESGTACAGARYAIVVLFAGADVIFELTLS